MNKTDDHAALDLSTATGAGFRPHLKIAVMCEPRQGLLGVTYKLAGARDRCVWQQSSQP